MKDSHTQASSNRAPAGVRAVRLASYLKATPELRFSFADTSSLQRGIVKLHKRETDSRASGGSSR